MLQSQSPSWRDQPVNVPLTESVPWTCSVKQFSTGATRKVPLLCWRPYTNIVKGTTDQSINFFKLNQLLESDVDGFDSYYKLTTSLTAFAINKLYWVDIFTRQSLVGQALTKTLPKAQRTRGLSSSCQSNFLRWYHKFKHKSWSHFIFRISTKHQLKISTKHQHLH